MIIRMDTHPMQRQVAGIEDIPAKPKTDSDDFSLVFESNPGVHIFRAVPKPIEKIFIILLRHFLNFFRR